MNVFLVLDETRFFHPEFVEDFLQKTKDRVVGCGLVVEIPPKNALDTYLRKHWRFLRFPEILKLVLTKARLTLQNISVRRSLTKFKIPLFEIRNNINTPEILDMIRQYDPDIIVSSNSLYFGKALLNLPKRGCINRHSALLPSYGGLWPAFQAYRNGEKNTGVTVHTMVEKIDSGVVLAQKEIPIKQSDTIFDLYRLCFAKSADVVLEALEKIRRNDLTPVPTDHLKPSYFSFPTEDHWKEFRERGGRFV